MQKHPNSCHHMQVSISATISLQPSRHGRSLCSTTNPGASCWHSQSWAVSHTTGCQSAMGCQSHTVTTPMRFNPPTNHSNASSAPLLLPTLPSTGSYLAGKDPCLGQWHTRGEDNTSACACTHTARISISKGSLFPQDTTAAS